MLKFSVVLFLFCLSFHLHSASPVVVENRQALQFAEEKLPHQGVLKIRNGYIYLKVDDRYIYAIKPLIDNSNLKTPPYFRRPDAPGAHISVVYADERDNLPSYIPEIGKVIPFRIIGLESVKVTGGKQYFLITVSAPELEAFRKKYGLSPQLKGHEFHITVGVIYKKENGRYIQDFWKIELTERKKK